MGIPIKNIYLSELSFGRTPEVPEKINFTYTISVGAKVDDSNIGQVNVKLDVFEKDTNSFKISCCMIGIFDLSDIKDIPISIDDFLFVNAPAIIFPYLREIVSNLTLRGSMKALILPTCNFKEMRDKKKQKEKKELEEKNTKQEESKN